MNVSAQDEQRSAKRRRLVGPEIVLPVEADGIIAQLPEERSRRVIGMRYTCKGKVRIWNGIYLLCEHAREVRYCDVCKVELKPRESADKVSPHLLDEWSEENEHPMSSFSGNSGRKVKWVCRNNSAHRWEATIDNRTRGTGCPHCASHRPIHDPNLRRAVLACERIRKRPTGEEEEVWFKELFQTLPGVESVEHTGFKFDKTDLIVTFNGQKRSVQVKAMSQKLSRNPNMFNIQCRNSYVDDMLIVSVDPSRTRFSVCFYHQFNYTTSLCFTFGNPRCKLRDCIFTDRKAFEQRLVELLPQAAEHVEALADVNKKEFAMWTRLEQHCAREGISIVRNVDATSTVDAWVDGRGCQLKYISLPAKGSRTYQVKFQKYGGMIGDKELRASYSIDDPIDYFIVEVGGTKDEPERYHGQFCVISRATAIERGIFATEESAGKASVYVCPPDYPKSHWTLACWSQFSATFKTQ